MYRQLLISKALILTSFVNASLHLQLPLAISTSYSLDSKEIKLVNPQGNQLWIFTGRTGAEAQAPILWPPDAESWLTGKDPDAGNDGEQEEKGMTEDEMAGWHHWLNGHEFEQIPRDSAEQGSLVCCSPWGSQRVRHDWATEQQLDLSRNRLTSS